MKKLLGIVVLGLLWCIISFAGTLKEDWARDTEIYIEGIKKCGDYAKRSGSYNSEEYNSCTTKFKELDDARIQRREHARDQKCKAAREKNSNTTGSASLSNAENFLLGMMGQLSEDMACGY